MLFGADIKSVKGHVSYSISDCIVSVYLEVTVTVQ